MELKRRLSLVVAIMSVALASGHLVQNVLITPVKLASATADVRPVDITLVAAGPEVVLPAVKPMAIELPTPSFAATATNDASSIFTPPDDPILQAELGTNLPVKPILADKCAMTFDLVAESAAMIGLTLVAPCRANERVVLRHDGLAVTGRTSGTGALFVSIPAFNSTAKVTVRFRDGQSIAATLALPEATEVRRFGVQWVGDDAFQLHAFENGADYGQPGHVSAADPQLPPAGQAAGGGFLSVLGNDQVEFPMLAEVYTYPVSSDAPVRIVVEAAVTKGTCAREILGETLADIGGITTMTELTLAMPDCSAVGDILVLKNLDPDLKIATAD